MTNYKSLFLFMLSLCSCKEPFINQENFDLLVFSSSGCYGNCPEMLVEVNKNREFKFSGIKNTELTGYYKAYLDDNFYHQFIYKLEHCIAEKKDSGIMYLPSPPDAQKYCLRFYTMNRKEQKYELMNDKENLYEFLLNLYKNVELTKVDTLLFKNNCWKVN